MNTISSYLSRLISIMNFPADIIDILIVSAIIYAILHMIRSKTASQIIKAVIALFLISYISNVAQLHALNFLTGWVIEIGSIALVVVFQPELRRLLERLGGTSIKNLFAPRTKHSNMEKVIEMTVAACRDMSWQRIGALIVFERQNELDEYFKTGTILDAAYSTELIKNIFFPNTALHDGAIIVREDRVMAASCVLPLTENQNLSRELGTRHRAAIGVSEHSDAVVVVVSEESGVISCVVGGVLKRYLTPDSLTRLLTQELVKEEQETAGTKLKNRIFGTNKEKVEDSHEAK